MLWWFLTITILLLLAYQCCPPKIWVSAVAIWIIISVFSDSLSTPAALLNLLLLGIIATPLFLHDLRRSLISEKLLALFRKLLPEMSETERIALEAGTVWWDKELFSGKPDWKRLQSTPPAHLNAEEQAFIDGPVEELCALINDWEITDKEKDLPAEVWAYLRQQRFFGMIIPKQYGGLEFSAYGHSCVITKIASRSITAAVTTMVPNSLGPAELLLHYGTDEQKNYYLPRLAVGDEIPCFALTGPEAGSDASAMTDYGMLCREEYGGKKDVLGIRLNWNKRYITLGPVATVLGLAFKLYDPDQLLGDEKSLGITLALIPTDSKGITIGDRHNPLNTPFQNGPNTGKDVFIPIDWVIGGRNGIGQGWRMLMESLAVGRSISLPALSTGAGKLVSATTGAYSRIRHQFRIPIGQFEGVEEALSRIAGYTYIMEATRRLTCTAVDIGEKPSVLSAIAKYNLTEMMRKTINDAMDVQGGSGICLGPRNLVGNAYQAIPVGITVEGANILTRTMIVFGQGAVRCHPYLLTEMRAAQDKDDPQSIKDFDEALFAHIGWSISNVARSLLLAITDARIITAPDSPARRYYQQISRMSACFAVAADTSAMLLGGSLKRRESLSGRLADALSHLYLGSAVLKHYLDSGEKKADRILLDWASQYCLYQVQEALLELYRNLPVKAVGWTLRLITFPLGRRFHLPDDKLNHRVAHLLQQPSETRDHLIAGIFISGDPQEPTARLEDALQQLVNTADIDKRLQKAIRGKLSDIATDAEKINAGIAQEIITTEEGEQLLSAWAARRDCIQVDSFKPAEGAVERARGRTKIKDRD
ncbi:MAG: acyl-CoA dehydrogenase [Pseudomonadota bacterium]|nr:acyl-CoA dehydrogenase [Pseudomonadota bacterium]